MYTESAEFYDLIYSTFKDYAAEAAHVATLLRRLNPNCTTILDVACGTGEHARLLTARGFAVDGIDLDPVFVGMARQKNPDGRFFEADMSDFHIANRYDAVLCLFSSIAYLQTVDRVRRAFACFRDHLAPNGIVVVEPFFAPGVPGVLYPAGETRHAAEANGVRVSRVSRLDIEGTRAHLHFEYEITDVTGNTRSAGEVHELGLFTTAELLQAFQDVGLEAEHDPKGPSDRGLYVAQVVPTRRPGV